jgi:hypothetical protein
MRNTGLEVFYPVQSDSCKFMLNIASVQKHLHGHYILIIKMAGKHIPTIYSTYYSWKLTQDLEIFYYLYYGKQQTDNCIRRFAHLLTITKLSHTDNSSLK